MSGDISFSDMGITDFSLFEPLEEFYGFSLTPDHPGALAFLGQRLYGSGLNVVFDLASSPDVLPAISSGVTSAASWVSTFANTIMSTPILLISAVLAFIGFGIGIFKRLRT